MEITDLLTPGSVIAALKAQGKKQLLQELAAKAAPLTGLPERRIFETMTVPGLNPNGYLNAESIVATQALWRRLGILQATLEPSQFVDNSYMDYALSVRGRAP